MANRHRGEIDAVLDGHPHRLCLTLGALAELESAFGDEDMLSLATRFERGRLGARDCVRIIGAGLRGAGLKIDDEIVERMRAEGGAAGFVDIVARLLAATFGGPAAGAGSMVAIAADMLTEEPAQPHPAAPPDADPQTSIAAPAEGRAKAIPFPGTR